MGSDRGWERCVTTVDMGSTSVLACDALNARLDEVCSLSKGDGCLHSLPHAARICELRRRALLSVSMPSGVEHLVYDFGGEDGEENPSPCRCPRALSTPSGTRTAARR